MLPISGSSLLVSAPASPKLRITMTGAFVRTPPSVLPSAVAAQRENSGTLRLKMAAYYTSQGYDAPATVIWSVLTDFATWPKWFPNISEIRVEDGAAAARGGELLAVGDDDNTWTRWEITDWTAPSLLVCEHIESNAPMSGQVQAAYLQFQLTDEPDGCTLEVEIGAEGHGMVGDFFVGMTLGPGARRMLPRLVDAFTAHVIEHVQQQP